MNRALNQANSWASAYREAGPTIRRQMYQAIFKKVYVDPDGGGITSELSEPFELLHSSEVIEAARDHARVLEADPNVILRELQAVYEERTKYEPSSRQGPETNKPRRLRDGV